jgi:histidine ammonia-lyase
MTVVLTGNDLTFAQLQAVTAQHESVTVSTDAIARMKTSRAVVDRLGSAS